LATFSSSNVYDVILISLKFKDMVLSVDNKIQPFNY